MTDKPSHPISPPHTHLHLGTGITDERAEKAHEFLEGEEEREHKAHPDLQIDRGHEMETVDGKTTEKKSKVEAIKEALHIHKK